MNTLSPIQPGSPQEMRARVLNVIELYKTGYLTCADVVRMGRRITNEYPNHPEAQCIILESLLDFAEEVIKAGKH